MEKNFLQRFLRGLSLGFGAVPGVSAGTMGVIFDIYDDLIGGLSGLTKHFWKSVQLMLPIVLGAALSAVLVVIGVHFGYGYAPFVISSLFAGFTIGSLPVVFPELSKEKVDAKGALGFGGGFLIAAGIGALSVVALVVWKVDLSQSFIDRDWWVFPAAAAVGFIAAFCCIIPGISGAMILFIFGLYNPVVSLYVGKDSIFHVPGSALSGLLLTLCLAVGALVGILTISKTMKILLAKHRSMMYKIIAGFIVGSVIAMFINNQIWPYYQGVTDANGVFLKIETWQYIVGAVIFVCAASVMGFLTIKANRKTIKATVDEKIND